MSAQVCMHARMLHAMGCEDLKLLKFSRGAQA